MRITRFGIGGAVAAALMFGGLAHAQDQGDKTIVLKSFDGFTQLRGELVDFDGERYVLETRLGRLEIDVFQVTCEGEACPANLLFGAEFGIYGSNAIGSALMPALVEGYTYTLDADLVREPGDEENRSTLRIVHPNGEEMAAIELAALGSGTAYAALADGTAAIGMSSRPIQDDEVALLGAAGIPDPRNSERENVVALDGVIIITHQDNPLSSISLAEIAGVFSGQITNWSELGGSDRPINVYARDAGSGTFDTFRSLVLAPNGAEIGADALSFADPNELSDSVAQDPDGIGFVGFAYARASRVVPVRLECGLLSYPTTFAIKAEEYPLARRLYLYTTDRQSTIHAENLVKFALSDNAAPFVEDAGFISLVPEGQSLREQGLRLTHAIVAEDEFSLPLMREMLTEFRDAERLSTTFRFTPGSSQLTAQSQRDAERFARDIIAGKYDGKEIILVGFTDSIGQFELNRALATRRAQGVLFTMNEAVINEAGSADFSGANITVQGYGELTPVGCNTTFAGRVANRRVEVWIR
ncbi:phosphate ABC transporter substrate-binding/OmpA family protein [Paralimibaculum aggregatum]|uniref:Phosphate ABC transporter substrate-binding/OmpA family protein n=1 Tax=Paralimibaculum aggregatum TaxID=3036245 RepID=A0ABQ6LTX5_9RHOB|nr:phosphate ABC transporter substrate-binding/OmpA family protein [Limibaculum sp. NKW23]GMG85532.1 phosphate ABC transporter substrate-binding/OmpA family protein [Limibaculum sp. NKW23]